MAGVRYTKWAQREIDDPEEARKFVANILPQVFPGFAEARTTVITEELLQKLRDAGIPMDDALKAGEWRLPENTARLLENTQMVHELLQQPEFIKSLPVTVGLGLMFAQNIYSGIALQKFGTKNLNVDQMFWTAGATLEWFAKLLKKKKPVDLGVGKGRANVELLQLIKKIREHQKEKLKPKELKQALEYAGYSISDEEALRLFEWRAKKRGQL